MRSNTLIIVLLVTVFLSGLNTRVVILNEIKIVRENIEIVRQIAVRRYGPEEAGNIIMYVDTVEEALEIIEDK